MDSVEQIRGNGPDAAKVHESVVDIFSSQAASLAFPHLHLVYTVPPYLPALAKNLGRALGERPVVSWPNVHVRDKYGAPDDDGLAVMETIFDRRCYGRISIGVPSLVFSQISSMA